MNQYIGKVKWFDYKLGYGFISSENIDKDVFVHFTEIKCDGYKKLNENDVVKFNYDQNSVKATNVLVIEKCNKINYKHERKNIFYNPLKNNI